MATIIPFKALRYTSDEPDISTKVAPPYDVILPPERQALLEQDNTCIVALELPEGSEDPKDANSKYKNAAEQLNNWIDLGVLVEDEDPGIYVLKQHFIEEGTEYTRTSIFAAVGLHEFEDGVILPHEATLPKALGDRYELLRTTEANLSPIFGLYQLNDNSPIKRLIKCAEEEGLLAVSFDVVGTRIELYSCTQSAVINAFTEAMEDVSIVIADGHHRYTVATAHAREKGVLGNQDKLAGSVMMALVEESDPGLIVKGYHRMISRTPELKREDVLEALSQNFDVESLDSLDGIEKKLSADTFGLIWDSDTYYLLKGKNLLDTMRQKAETAGVEHTDEHLELDTVVARELILPALDVDSETPEGLARLTFTDSLDEVMDEVATGNTIGLLLAPLSVETIGNVARSGDVTPQKSTFFTPKLPSGFLMRDINENRYL